MLTEAQLDIIGEALTPYYQALEKFVIQDIARRLAKTGRFTETAELQAQALREQGFSPARIQREVMKQLNGNAKFKAAALENTAEYKKALSAKIKAATATAKKTAADAMPEIGNLAFRGDLSLWAKAGQSLTKPGTMSQITSAYSKQLAGNLANITKTTAFTLKTGAIVPSQQAYARALDNALVRVTSGVQSYADAVRSVMREMADSGLKTIDYASGVKRQVDSAARNAMSTAAGQLSGSITDANCAQTGVNHVEVSSHLGARTDGTGGHGDHQAWQGKVYMINGKDDQYANLEEATGYPSDPTGLHGYNCRHEHFPFWVGISEPNPPLVEPPNKTYNGKEYTYYQSTQRQRALESDIKRYKRRAYADEALGLDTKALNGLIEAKKDAYAAFSKAVDIRPKWERTMVDGDDAADWKRVFEKE